VQADEPGHMHEWREHTSEIELHIVAATERDVFREATAAIADQLGEATGADGVQRRIAVDARDRAALLAAWLDELVWLAEREGLIPRRLVDLELDETAARGTVELCPGRPRHLVKAVTFHRLAFGRDGDRWRATVIFDV